MTPNQIIEIALDRVGLTATTATFKNRARQYLNLAGSDIYTWSIPVQGGVAPIRWQWAFKDTTFTTSAGTRSYTLGADVLEPLQFRDQTNDHTIPFESSVWLDGIDPDADETGDPERIIITGQDAATGYWNIDIYPTPDATNTIAHRYYAQWVNLTSAEDDTDLRAKLPNYLHEALIYGVSSRYYDEKGSSSQAAIERSLGEAIVNQAVARNIQGTGANTVRMARKNSGFSGAFSFRVQDGTLT